MSYQGNTLLPGIEHHCQKLADAARDGDAEALREHVTAALVQVLELYAYCGGIPNERAYVAVHRLLDLPLRIPGVVIRDNRKDRDGKGRFITHSDRSAQWLDDDNVVAIKKESK